MLFWVLKSHIIRVPEKDAPPRVPSLSPTAVECGVVGRCFPGGGDLSGVVMPLQKVLIITMLPRVWALEDGRPI